MEVTQGYEKTHGNIKKNDWRDCDISDLCSLQRGFDITEATRKTGSVPVYSSSGLSYYHNEARLKPPAVITGRKGILGKVFLVEEPCWPHDTTLWVKDFKGNDPRFVYQFLIHFKLERFDAATSVPTLNRNNLVRIPIKLPPLPIQCIIAEALSDADSLIESFEKLIAKKQQLKQGVMLELLTGEKRLPKFNEKWETRALGEISSVMKGTQLHVSEMSETGHFAHLNGGITPSGYSEKENTPGGTIAISEGGNSCGHVQFMIEPYWCGGHCYSVTPRGINNGFLYQSLKAQQTSIMALRVGSGLPNIQKTTLLSFKLTFPRSSSEQIAIASILSDMDAEIDAVEAKLVKTRQLKQGMMQNLLTGKIRLV